jgi:hypothetical protein
MGDGGWIWRMAVRRMDARGERGKGQYAAGVWKKIETMVGDYK